jgi:hypothetical protein
MAEDCQKAPFKDKIGVRKQFDRGRRGPAGIYPVERVFYRRFKNNDTMNSNNFEILADQLKKFGFGKDILLTQSLETLMDRGLSEFELFTEAFFDVDTKMEAKLYFISTDAPGLYQFVKYRALLRYAGEPEKDRLQTFYLCEGEGIAFREAFNLLQGRSVCKMLVNPSGEQYTAWVRINFDADKDGQNDYSYDYVNNADFDLEKVLRKYPITDLAFDGLRASMIDSLKRGNRYLATFKEPTKTQLICIEANPAMNTLNIIPGE